MGVLDSAGRGGGCCGRSFAMALEGSGGVGGDGGVFIIDGLSAEPPPVAIHQIGVVWSGSENDDDGIEEPLILARRLINVASP